MSEKVAQLTTEQMEAEKKALEIKKAEKNTKIKERLVGYKMRELQANDIFKIIEIVNILNVTELVTDFLKQKDAAKIQTQKAQGLALIASNKDEAQKETVTNQIKSIQEDISAQSFEFVANAAKFVLSHSNEIKAELNGFLADLTGKTPEEIGETNIVTYSLLVKDFFLKPELKEVLELLF
ncbi:hypothetical protein [Enterococcus saccharolyticus]|uniref:hypothetical protein n=1 Tax=Enterococcus saccharolyticus TaxID=41997 RepID=UPI0039E130D4